MDRNIPNNNIPLSNKELQMKVVIDIINNLKNDKMVKNK